MAVNVSNLMALDFFKHCTILGPFNCEIKVWLFADILKYYLPYTKNIKNAFYNIYGSH